MCRLAIEEQAVPEVEVLAQGAAKYVYLKSSSEEIFIFYFIFSWYLTHMMATKRKKELVFQ
jgi:hypothetical protein